MSFDANSGMRRADPQDANAVRRIVRAAYAQWIPVIGREPMPMKTDYERAVREHEIELLYEGGALVALIEVIVNADHLFIENIAVAPDHQGRGIGRRLLSHAEQRATDLNLRELRLLTNQAFEANVRLYKSIGFQIARAEPLEDGGTVVHMSKTIGTAT